MFSRSEFRFTENHSDIRCCSVESATTQHSLPDSVFREPKFYIYVALCSHSARGRRLWGKDVERWRSAQQQTNCVAYDRRRQAESSERARVCGREHLWHIDTLRTCRYHTHTHTQTHTCACMHLACTTIHCTTLHYTKLHDTTLPRCA